MNKTEYKVIEHDGFYHCLLMKDGAMYGGESTFTTLEEVFAWLRLMLGAYPDTFEKGA